MASFDQVRNDSRSRSGTPRSSQITEMGSGKDNASTRSARPSGAASMRSSSASVVFWMRGVSSSTRRVVNSRATSLRSRVWSGGSARSMCGPEETAPNGRSGEALLQSFESLGSVRAARLYLVSDDEPGRCTAFRHPDAVHRPWPVTGRTRGRGRG